MRNLKESMVGLSMESLGYQEWREFMEVSKTRDTWVHTKKA